MFFKQPVPLYYYLYESRLLLGLTEKGKRVEIKVMGTTWSYADAMRYKCDECFLEAGPQLILQVKA